MNTLIQPAPAMALPPSTTAIGETIRMLRALTHRIRAWLETRKRVAEDRDTLARMSDRDLLDIGIDRGSVEAVATGAWARDLVH